MALAYVSMKYVKHEFILAYSKSVTLYQITVLTAALQYVCFSFKLALPSMFGGQTHTQDMEILHWKGFQHKMRGKTRRPISQSITLSMSGMEKDDKAKATQTRIHLLHGL